MQSKAFDRLVNIALQTSFFVRANSMFSRKKKFVEQYLLVEKLCNWFQFNNFRANASKCPFFLSPYKPVTIKIKESAVESPNSEKRLDVTIDSKLSFDDCITNLCSKTSQKIHALSRVGIYLSFVKKDSFKNIYCLVI